MNYWHRWIGSIQKKTGHLSCAEMGVYDRLLDHYYATEKPLPGDVDACCRIARAMSKEERKAVDSVLNEFFVLNSSGAYENERADEEMFKSEPKLTAARTNGAKGGRPRKNPQETQKKPSGLSEETQSETSTTSTTTKEEKKKPPTPKVVRVPGFDASLVDLPSWLDEDAWQRWCKDRSDRKKPITEGAVKLQIAKLKTYVDAGTSATEVLNHAIASGHQGFFLPMKTAANTAAPEPAWRRQARDTANAWSGGLAGAKAPSQTTDFIDMEDTNATAPLRAIR